jgi:hypothetical protein
MRLPQGGQFVDGNPDNGTIVRAQFLNAVLGELTALLALGDVDPLASGDLPGDHSQLADLFAAEWLRVGEDPPTGGVANAVWLRPSLLLAGEWPFFVHNGSDWATVPDPLPEPVEEEEPEEDEPLIFFNDLVHGQRGGGSLHVPATAFQGGFMSPEAVVALQELVAVHPRVFRSTFAVEAGAGYVLTHGLPGIPDLVAVTFAVTGTPDLEVDTYRDSDNALVGCRITRGAETVGIQVGDHCWGGLIGSTYTRYTAGFYTLRAVYFGANS